MEELMSAAVQNKHNPNYKIEYEAILRCLEYWKQNDFWRTGTWRRSLSTST